MNTLTINQAKRDLGKLADEALKGKTIFILRKGQLLSVQKFHRLEPIEIPPPGFFRDCYTKAEAKVENRLAKRSIQRVVR